MGRILFKKRKHLRFVLLSFAAEPVRTNSNCFTLNKKVTNLQLKCENITSCILKIVLSHDSNKI